MKTTDFIQNKYYTWYSNIVSVAKNRNITDDVYTEIHHIVPKSLDGDNSKENLVILTAEEHYICHRLLTKFTSGTARSKMVHAVWSMMRAAGDQPRYAPKASVYAKIKAEMAQETRVRQLGVPRSAQTRANIAKSKIGNLNPMYGKCHTDETKFKISQSMVGKEKSPEYIKAMSEQRMGDGNPMYGKKHSEIARIKISAASTGRSVSEETKNILRNKALSRPKLVCQHCSKQSKAGPFARWHGDNCKKNKEIV
jgi:5-methylcytosine-specific restriction endonuclease McrA